MVAGKLAAKTIYPVVCYRQGAETSATSEILPLLAFKPFASVTSLFANFGNLKVKRFLEAFTRLTKMKRLLVYYYATAECVECECMLSDS